MAVDPNPYAPPTSKDPPRPIRRRPMPLPPGLRWARFFLMFQLLILAAVAVAALLVSSFSLPRYWPVFLVLQGSVNIALVLVIQWRAPLGRWLLPGWFALSAIAGGVQLARGAKSSGIMLGTFVNLVLTVYLPMDKGTKPYFAPDLDQSDQDDPVAPLKRGRRRRETS